MSSFPSSPQKGHPEWPALPLAGIEVMSLAHFSCLFDITGKDRGPAVGENMLIIVLSAAPDF